MWWSRRIIKDAPSSETNLDEEATPKECPTAGHPASRVSLSDLPKLKNDLLLRAARGESTDRMPVWVMRQAGRYLPEFRELRKTSDFFTMCRTPELSCALTLQPLERYPDRLDAVIIFSDILIVPQAVGMEVRMVPGKGPVFPKPLVTPSDLDSLNMKPDIEATLGYLFDAINLTRQRVAGRVPVIGFAGGPWTLMAYMVEGSGSKTFSKAKTWLFKYPEATRTLLSGLSDVIIELLVGEYEAGAQYLQLFESWAGELAPRDFRSFLLPEIKRIVDGVRSRVPPVSAGGPPFVVFAKGAHYAISDLAELDINVIGLDWTIDPAEAAAIVKGKGKTLQGNLDPCVLYGGPEVVSDHVQKIVAGFGSTPVVANLGHGMHPTHNPEMMRSFLDAIHLHSKK